MIVTHYGHEFFKVQLGDTVLAFNPIGKSSKYKVSRFGADVVFVTANRDDMNGIDMVAFGGKIPYAITGPGEYEVKGIFARGVGVESKHGSRTLQNTIYTLEFDGIKLCFLGAISSLSSLTSDVKSRIGEVDILFVPIGGGDVLTPSDAHKAALALEPKMIIPMHFDAAEEKEALKSFIKEAGDGVSPIDKLTIKRRDIEGQEGSLVVLSPST